jgi:hypothetical protein
LLDLNFVFCFISAGKRKHQTPHELELSKRPKGPTASVRREKARVMQEDGDLHRQQRKEAHKQAKAQAHASHSEANVAATAVDLPEGAPVAVPEVQAASSHVAPDLQDGSSDSEGEELSESEFGEEEEHVVLFREPNVPKRKKNDVKSPL